MGRVPGRKRGGWRRVAGRCKCVHSTATIPRQIQATSPDRDPDALAAQKVKTDDAIAKVWIPTKRRRLLCEHIGIRVPRHHGADLDGIEPMDVRRSVIAGNDM